MIVVAYMAVSMVGALKLRDQMEPDLMEMHISKTMLGAWVMTTVKWVGVVL